MYNGTDAEHWALGVPDTSLVLMDIDLGNGPDGPETAQRILARKTLPIVFVTSHAEKEYVERVRKITRYGFPLARYGIRCACMWRIQVAQQDSFFTSLVKVMAASLSPSAIVR